MKSQSDQFGFRKLKHLVFFVSVLAWLCLMISCNIQGKSWTMDSSFHPGVPAGGNSSSPIKNRSITIDHTKVPNTDQANFPVLVSITDPTLRTTANGGHVQNINGYDIQFFSNATSTIPLFWEMENYDGLAGTVIAWVQVPIVSHTTDTVFYISYGNKSITSFQSTASSVWDINYKGVWHFENASTLISPSPDSTTNGISGAIANVVAAPGKIGGAGTFNGTNTTINMGDQPIHNVTNITFSTWTYAISYPFLINNMAGKEQVASPYFGYSLRVTSGNLEFNAAIAGTSYTVGAVPLSTGSWHYIVGTYDGTTMRLYLDGPQVASTVIGGAMMTAVTGLTIGDSFGYPGRLWNGFIDEIRLSNTVRPNSADWIQTEYNNQNSPSTFYSLGAEQ